MYVHVCKRLLPYTVSVVKEHPWAVYLTCLPGTFYNRSVSTLVYESVLMFVGAVEMMVSTQHHLADNSKVK